ncbi:Metallo-hydrolase/oxidoreductase [Xylaria sp. FL1777]|nr:Metallo-hydrolase/oxidoreductase [Xylaria sp. FL1777]
MDEPAGKKHKGGYRQINKALNICAFDDFLESQLSHLPDIADVEQISSRVIRVLGQNAGKFTLQGTNTYIVGTGPLRLIIDTGQGIPEWADIISLTLSDSKIALSRVLLTHWHGDHTGGVPDLVRMYPSLTNAIYKNAPSKGQREIVDGQVFKVEGATVRAVHAPGHSHDHMCFVLEEENAMFTGDNVLGHGTAAVEHLSSWMASLRTMASHGCRIGYPAHGMAIQDLPRKIEAELSSKTRREMQILQALNKLRDADPARKGRVTVKELVSEMHGGQLDDEVRRMAVEPLTEEVLKKLAEDGTVAFQVRNGEKKWYSISTTRTT